MRRSPSRSCPRRPSHAPRRACGRGRGRGLLQQDGAGDGAEEGAADGEADAVVGGQAGGGDPAHRDEGEARVDGDEQRRRHGVLRQLPQPLAQQPRVRGDPLVRVVYGGGAVAAAAAANVDVAAAAAWRVAADPEEEPVCKVAAGGVRGIGGDAKVFAASVDACEKLCLGVIAKFERGSKLAFRVALVSAHDAMRLRVSPVFFA